MVKWRFPGSLYFENTRKSFKSNLVLVVELVLESKGLQFWNEKETGQSILSQRLLGPFLRTGKKVANGWQALPRWVSIPETFAGYISVPVPFSSLNWQMNVSVKKNLTYGSSGVNTTGSFVNCGSKLPSPYWSSIRGLNGGGTWRASN